MRSLLVAKFWFQFVGRFSADRTFDLCIVDDASLCSEAELLPLFRLKINTLLLVGDEKLQTSTTQNEVNTRKNHH